MRNLWLIGATLVTSTAAHAIKTNLTDIHFGSSIGAAYADQVTSGSSSWDVVPKLTTSTYKNPSDYKTPLRMGVFYRHPQFTVDTYLRYFTNYRSAWTLSGTNTGEGNSRYKGVGFGVDFEMPMYTGKWFRGGLMVNAEYIRNHVIIAYTPSSGGTQNLQADTSNKLFGVGAFLDTYVGDLWSVGLHGVYAYDLGGTWKAGKSSTFLGVSHTAGQSLLDTTGVAATSNFSHWRVEAVLRLAFK